MPGFLTLPRERPAQANHPRLLLPGLDAAALGWIVQGKPAQATEFAGILDRRLDRHLVRPGIPARRMQDRAVHPGRVHLRDQLLSGIAGGLAMMVAGLAAAPDMHLRVDDQ